MNVLAVLIALVVDRAAPQVESWRARDWATPYFGMLREQFGSFPAWGAVAPVILMVGVPAALAAFLLWALAAVHAWLAALTAPLLILWALGPHNPSRLALRYAETLEADGEAQPLAARLLPGAPAEPAACSAALTAALPAATLGAVVAPLTWALLLGAPGALLWRAHQATGAWLAVSGSETDAEHGARRRAQADLAGVLGWLPVRLLMLALAIAGRSEEAFATWRQWRRPAGLTREVADAALLGAVALAALGEQADEEDHGAYQVWAMAALLDRALVLWGLACALGWLGALAW